MADRIVLWLINHEYAGASLGDRRSLWDKTQLNWKMTAVALAMGVMLAGCAAPQVKTTESKTPAKPAETVSAKTFTTEGKPTKTIETPWGPREIYDPAQDEEVIAAFDDLKTNNPSIKYPNPFSLPTENLAHIAATIHYLDMKRLGCRSVTLPSKVSESVDIVFWDNHKSFQFASLCFDDSSLGKIKLSPCEINNIKYSTGPEMFAQSYIGQTDQTNMEPLISQDPIYEEEARLKDIMVSHRNLQINSFSEMFDMQCASWARFLTPEERRRGKLQ